MRPAINCRPGQEWPFAGLDRRGTGDCLFVPTISTPQAVFTSNEPWKVEAIVIAVLIVLILCRLCRTAHIREHFLSVEGFGPAAIICLIGHLASGAEIFNSLGVSRRKHRSSHFTWLSTLLF